MNWKKPVLPALVLGLALTGFSSSAFAQENIAGKRVYYPSSTDSGVTSIYADIRTPGTYQATYSPSGSPSYVMITDSGSKYVQVGWTKESGISSESEGVHYFFEKYEGSGVPYSVFNQYGPDLGYTHGYRVYVDSNGNWVGTVDNATIGSGSKNWKGSTVYYAEEIFGNPATNSAFAGLSGDHAKFSNMRAFYNGQTYYSPVPNDTWWTTTTLGAYNDSNYQQGVSTSTIDMWDTRY